MSDAASRRRLTVLIAPDSFKGSLTSVEVARALAAGWGTARPADTLLLAPLADGGEGTLVAIEAAGGWTVQTAPVHDPLDREIEARWLRSSDGTRAVIEMAEASGLSRVAPDERDPIAATSRGTGELMRIAARSGATRMIVGIGGSATSDGGRGLLEGLAGDPDGRLDHLANVASTIDVEVACDVTNPLHGPNGAAAVYGPQKGATPDQVRELQDRLERWHQDLQSRTGRREHETPGAGAAGGVGFAFLMTQAWFRSFAMRPGVDLVMDATGFAEKLARADLVITGEGRIDAQTAFGKTALGVARRAAVAGVASIAVGGGVEPDGIEALRPLGCVVVPVVERPQTVEAAMAAGTGPLERCGERIARLVDLGRRVGASSSA
jgi:glycerate kinase